jgi:hypothetical protein
LAAIWFSRTFGVVILRTDHLGPSKLGRKLRRRQIIKLLGTATAWPLAARAQRTITPLIGYLSSKGKFAEAGSVVAMREGLKERGFIDRVNVRIEYRWCDGNYGRLPQLAADLINQNVNVTPPRASRRHWLPRKRRRPFPSFFGWRSIPLHPIWLQASTAPGAISPACRRYPIS